MIEEINGRVRKICGEVFRVDPDELSDDVRRGELDGWDSLGHLDLVSALEKQFSVRLRPEQALEIETIGDAKRVLARLLSDSNAVSDQ